MYLQKKSILPYMKYFINRSSFHNIIINKAIYNYISVMYYLSFYRCFYVHHCFGMINSFNVLEEYEKEQFLSDIAPLGYET